MSPPAPPRPLEMMGSDSTSHGERRRQFWARAAFITANAMIVVKRKKKKQE